MTLILGHNGLDAPIREDCAVCIGHLSKLLSWSHYLTLFRKVYGLVRFHILLLLPPLSTAIIIFMFYPFIHLSID